MNKIQIGIGKQWTGLGDILGLLTVLNHMPDKYQLVLSSKNERFMPLFEGYDVIVNDSILPISTHLNIPTGLSNNCHAYKTALNNLHIDSNDIIPKFRIDLFKKHSNCDFMASSNKNKYQSEVIFVSNCSKSGQRDRGFSYDRLLSYIRTNRNIFFHHFRLNTHYSFTNEQNVVEYTDIDLVSYALACNKIKKYVGFNTGDYHLAAASGINPNNMTVLMPKRNKNIKQCIIQWIYAGTKMEILDD